jgi:hypothetical protein
MNFSEFNELSDQESELEKHHKKTIELADIIHQNPFDYLKSKDDIFNKDTNVESVIEKISKKFLIEKILFKISPNASSNEKIIEMKFNASAEEQIYKFINALYYELPGIAKFESIKIAKLNEQELSIKIVCRTFSCDESIKNFVSICDSNGHDNMRSINLFAIKKTLSHKLFCVINNSKAYIDNSWFGIGETIGEGKIVDISEDSIKIQCDNNTINVKLGHSWK